MYVKNLKYVNAILRFGVGVDISQETFTWWGGVYKLLYSVTQVISQEHEDTDMDVIDTAP